MSSPSVGHVRGAARFEFPRALSSIGSSIKDSLAVVIGFFKENKRSLEVQERKLVAKMSKLSDEKAAEPLQEKLNVIREKLYKFVSVEKKLEGIDKLMDKIAKQVGEKDILFVGKGEDNKVEFPLDWSARDELKRIRKEMNELSPLVEKEIKKNVRVKESFESIQLKITKAELIKKRQTLIYRLEGKLPTSQRKEDLETEIIAITQKLGELEEKDLGKKKAIEVMTAGIHPKHASKEFVKLEPKLREFRKDFDQILRQLSRTTKALHPRYGAKYQESSWKMPLEGISKEFNQFIKKNKTKDPLTNAYIEFIKTLQAQANLLVERHDSSVKIAEAKALLASIKPKERIDFSKMRTQEDIIDKEEDKVERLNAQLSGYSEQLEKVQKKLFEDFDVATVADNTDRFVYLVQGVAKLRHNLAKHHEEMKQYEIDEHQNALAKLEIELEKTKEKLKKEFEG
jgi:hypothetical protein